MPKSETERRQLARVLIVDDDDQLRSMLAELLKMEHYTVVTAADGAEALAEHAREPADLWVLDVMMPGRNGFEVLKQLRASSTCPVIMLTARGEPDDRIEGFEHGADDYLAKPFNPRELLLRVQAILKRAMQSPTDGNTVIRAGDLTVDPANLKATLKGNELPLTGAELRILQALAEQPGSPVSRESLNEFALSRELTPFDRALDTHVSNLRRKLSEAGASSTRIRSLRGEGYLLVSVAESA